MAVILINNAVFLRIGSKSYNNCSIDEMHLLVQNFSTRKATISCELKSKSNSTSLGCPNQSYLWTNFIICYRSHFTVSSNPAFGTVTLLCHITSYKHFVAKRYSTQYQPCQRLRRMDKDVICFDCFIWFQHHLIAFN